MGRSQIGSAVTQSQPLLEARNVIKRFGGIGWAQNDFSTLFGQRCRAFRDFGLVADVHADLGKRKLANLHLVAFGGRPVCFGRKDVRFGMLEDRAIRSEQMGNVLEAVANLQQMRPAKDILAAPPRRRGRCSLL